MAQRKPSKRTERQARRNLTNLDLPAAVYARVSKRAGREGESYQSKEEQVKDGGRGAALNNHEVKMIVVEEDVSGAKDAHERGLEKILVAAERGEIGTIYVAYLDRLTRGTGKQTADVYDRIIQAKCRLVVVNEGIDTANPGAEMQITMRGALAREQWVRYAETHDRNVASAIGRGIYVAAYPPAGYNWKAENDKHLEIDSVNGPLVLKAFEMRADGATFRNIADFWDESGLPCRKKVWSIEGVSQILGNRAYLGEARQGDIVNLSAHKPLVPAKLWAAVQARKGKPMKRRGLADNLLCAGLVRCANCGYRMAVGQDTRRGRNKDPFYTCQGWRSGGNCTKRAFIQSAMLDPYIDKYMLKSLGTKHPFADAHSANARLEAAEAAEAKAEAELDAYMDTGLASVIGEAKFMAQVEKRQHALDAARSVAYEARSATAALGSVVSGDLYAAWPTLSVQHKRGYLTATMEQIVVTSVEGRRGVPVEERGIEVVWALPFRDEPPNDVGL